MDSFIAFFNDLGSSISNFFGEIYSFLFEGGLTSLLVDFLDYLYQLLVELTLFLSKKGLEAVLGVVQELVQSLNVTSGIEGYWSAIPVEYQNLLVFFHLPLILTMLISAFITKKLLRFVGF